MKFWHITAFLKIKREKYKNLQTKSVTTSPGLPYEEFYEVDKQGGKLKSIGAAYDGRKMTYMFCLAAVCENINWFIATFTFLDLARANVFTLYNTIYDNTIPLCEDIIERGQPQYIQSLLQPPLVSPVHSPSSGLSLTSIRKILVARYYKRG